MKIGGRTVAGPKQVLLVIPREDGDIVFKFVGVNNDTDYDKQFPPPKPPIVKSVKLGTTGEDRNDPDFTKKFSLWAEAKTNWYFLESIRPSEIEWATVNLADPATFGNWQQDFRAAGFSTGEINQIYTSFTECNMLTESMLSEARKRFLASQEGIELSVEQ